MTNHDFQLLIAQKGDELWRDMPWRNETYPYYVLVSELMLQQTQVGRVVPKFDDFIQQFPDETSLAAASLADVLRVWLGLGYNRRAKFLHESARMVTRDFDGVFPNDESDIMKLPGVGVNTAGAIRAYAFNQPSLFVETNIRTVYIHHFFSDDVAVDDRQIIEKLAQTLDYENPRRFYQALMDYGSFLKQSGVKNHTRSRQYKKQSPLAGSVREVRGQMMRQLGRQAMTESQLRVALQADDRFAVALEGLVNDGLIGKTGDHFHLTK